MASLSKADFDDWQAHPITKSYMVSVYKRIEDLKGSLAGGAGLDPSNDRFVCGMIRAFSEVLNVEVDEVIQEKEENA